MWAIALLLVGGFTSTVSCQTDNVWSDITPLKTTRQEAEKRVGKPLSWSIAEHSATYDTKEARISISYSPGRCEGSSTAEWDVPKGMVTRVDVSPNYPNPYRFSQLQIDSKKFEKRSNPHNINLIFYTNESDGVTLTVDSSDGTVRSFSYYPGSKFESLKCKEQ